MKATARKRRSANQACHPHYFGRQCQGGNAGRRFSVTSPPPSFFDHYGRTDELINPGATIAALVAWLLAEDARRTEQHGEPVSWLVTLAEVRDGAEWSPECFVYVGDGRLRSLATNREEEAAEFFRTEVTPESLDRFFAGINARIDAEQQAAGGFEQWLCSKAWRNAGGREEPRRAA